MVYWLGFGAFMAVVKAVRSHKSCSAAKKKKKKKKKRKTERKIYQFKYKTG